MWGVLRWPSLMALAGALGGCTSLVGLEELEASASSSTTQTASTSDTTTSSQASSGSGGMNQGGAGGSDPQCPQGLPGPELIDVGPFCIDRTEVNNAQYQDFVYAQPTPNYGAECAFNDNLIPDNFPQPPENQNLPVAWVDWCDAYAFCQWAGKRLCGKIGGGYGNLEDFDDATLSEWYFACTNGGQTAYPYGNVPDPDACHGIESWMSSGDYLIDVGSLATCHGTVPPFEQVFDMSGNVFEFTAECDPYSGPTDPCNVRGGTSPHSAAENSCYRLWPLSRDTTESNLGFRCCADKQ